MTWITPEMTQLPLQIAEPNGGPKAFLVEAAGDVVLQVVEHIPVHRLDLRPPLAAAAQSPLLHTGLLYVWQPRGRGNGRISPVRSPSCMVWKETRYAYGAGLQLRRQMSAFQALSGRRLAHAGGWCQYTASTLADSPSA